MHKIMESFEDFYIKEAIREGYDESDVDIEKVDGEYVSIITRIAWWGWKSAFQHLQSKYGIDFTQE